MVILKKQIFIIGTIICIFLLSGCESIQKTFMSSDEQKLLGRWEGHNAAYTGLYFYIDGFSKKIDYNFGVGLYTLDWKTDNGRIIITGPGGSLSWIYRFDGNDKLYLDMLGISQIPGYETLGETLFDRVNGCTIMDNNTFEQKDTNKFTWEQGSMNVSILSVNTTKFYDASYGDVKKVDVWLKIDFEIYINTNIRCQVKDSNYSYPVQCKLFRGDGFSPEEIAWEERWGNFGIIECKRNNSPGNIKVNLVYEKLSLDTNEKTIFIVVSNMYVYSGKECEIKIPMYD